MTTEIPQGHTAQEAFHALVQRINERFNALDGPVFRTDARGLYEAYLATFQEGADRQLRTCSCCRAFIERYGALATVDDSGQLVSAVWSDNAVPAPYRDGFAAMRRLVHQASLTVPFLSADAIYGKPDSNGWRHYAIAPRRVFQTRGLSTAFQAASAKREEFQSVRRALADYAPSTCANALRLLKADTLENAEAALGQAQFLVDLHAARDAVTGQQRKDHLVYRLVAAAPSGFCHPRSSMIATLLDDIKSGLAFEEAAARWAAKMHPLKYLRPQAAPTAGAIQAAEEAFDKLGAATALQRRFATMADVLETVWLPRSPAAPVASGIFASVKAKVTAAPAAVMTAPAIVMTLEKFRREVLPEAERIDMQAPDGRDAFVALTTAVHADARPIYQWDHAEQRNPVAWYLYHGGSQAREFNLRGPWHEVIAIVAPPHAWAGQHHPQQGEGLILLLRDARDLSQGRGGLALFPSCLKGELHGFRSTIEAYSTVNRLAGYGEDNVAGLLLRKGAAYHTRLRVTAGGQVADYELDRWD